MVEGSSLSTPQDIRAGDEGSSDVLEEPQPSLQVYEEPKQASGSSRGPELRPPVAKDRLAA
jgi:hypothetical protein